MCPCCLTQLAPLSPGLGARTDARWSSYCTRAARRRVPTLMKKLSLNQGEDPESFKDDYEAALLEEQRAKDAVNEARRAHKAAKERLEKMHGYAKEFETILNGNKPASTDDDKAAKPKEDAPPRLP